MKKLSSLFFIVVVTIAVLITAPLNNDLAQGNVALTAIPTLPAPTDAEMLVNVLQNENCPHLCFMGIHFGTTTRQELDVILADLNIVPQTDQLPDGEYMYYFDLPLEYVPFLPGDALAGVDIMFGDDIAIRGWIMMLPGLPVTTVIDAFGNPDAVRSSEDTGFYLTYFNERLMFHVNAVDDPERVNGIFVVSPYSEYNNIDAPFMPNVDTPCEEYGIPPCIAPTAVSVSATPPPQMTAVTTLESPESR